ncbi:hypothetical protein ACHAWF_015576 [Thalassiosira exigua]
MAAAAADPPPRHRPPAPRRLGGGGALRVASVVLLVAASLLGIVPFVALGRLGLENASSVRHALDRPTRSRDGGGAKTGGGAKARPRSDARPDDDDVAEPASCEEMTSDPTIWDPNEGLAKNETRRRTVTDPPFDISLHSKNFDKMRWVHIMQQGEYYERGLTRLFHRILSAYDSAADPPPLVLDVGMNIGWFSLYSRAHGHDVAAFEPNPLMFLRVCESLAYNGWDADGRVSLWNYGLDSKSGTLNLTLGKNPGGSSFHEDRLAPKFRRTIPVRVTTLDGVARKMGWLDRTISLAKVDVEGYEDHVFAGGTTLLRNGNVENVLMENSITDVAIAGGMADALYDAGYRVKQILTVNGDPYHEDWWPTFNPELERRAKSAGDPPESDQIR